MVYTRPSPHRLSGPQPESKHLEAALDTQLSKESGSLRSVSPQQSANQGFQTKALVPLPNDES